MLRYVVAEDQHKQVSVLFSEPKIPQWHHRQRRAGNGRGFSALQRAENSSIESRRAFVGDDGYSFSALQRAENSSILRPALRCSHPLKSFSALQRAENSSIDLRARRPLARTEFQCSSASRKFLNRCTTHRRRCIMYVSVLFSEPKIPQSLMRVSNSTSR